MTRALVVGLGVANEAVARQLLKRGWDVVVTDDNPSGTARQAAGTLGLTLVEAPDPSTLARLVRGVDVVLPGPGVKLSHPIYAIAAREGRPLWSEFELAAQWDDRPI